MSIEIRIGLEIHCQLTKLNSKLFCPCNSDYRDMKPNTNICPICIGLPGTLPRINKKAIEYAAMISVALGCNIPEKIAFDRKNYFYPDLPKNFQITQYESYGNDTCLGKNGLVKYDEEKEVRIRRIQLEEDPGRLVYENVNTSKSYTLIDYNRSGIALVEIVTEPDFKDPKEVRIFLNKMSSILEHLNVCNTSLEGSVRCDANISIGQGKKVEIKNVGSFKDVEKALSYEITRQKTMNLHDIEVKAETRHWDDKRKTTKGARSKEGEEDYRYFQEPDIPIITLTDLQNKLNMPELPDERRLRFIKNYGLSQHVSQVLINNKIFADLFEEAIEIYNSPKSVSNWIVSDLMGLVDTETLDKKIKTGEIKINAKHIAELAKIVDSNLINRNSGKDILMKIIKTGELPSEIIQEGKILKIQDKDEILEIVEKVFEIEKNAVFDSQKNPNAANFLLGKVMQLTKGKADPKLSLDLIKKKLERY